MFLGMLEFELNKMCAYANCSEKKKADKVPTLTSEIIIHGKKRAPSLLSQKGANSLPESTILFHFPSLFCHVGD